MIQREKVRLRERSPTDLLREALWSGDPETQALDPSVGLPLNARWFSIDTSDGVHIGTCGIYNFDNVTGQLGIRIGDKSYWNKGYGTDATRAFVDYCFATLGMARIWLKVLPANIRAIRCYEKSGFTECGKLAIGGYEFTTMEIRRTT